MHADRTNRAMLLLLSLLLIAAGVCGGAAAFGFFGSSIEGRKLSNNPVWTYVGNHGDWIWPVAAVVAVLLLALSLRWLLTLLFSTDRISEIRLPGNGKSADHIAGRTRLTGAALSDAVAEEIKSYRGVSTARAYLTGDEDEPELIVTAALEETADFAATPEQIESGALAHARQAVGNATMPITLDLSVSKKSGPRVS